MPTLQSPTPTGVQELLQAAQRLGTTDLEQFAQQVIALRAQREASGLPGEEAELLKQINQGMPQDAKSRYDHLVASRQGEELTESEHQELLRLTDQMEQLETERLEHLVKLAEFRGTTLTALMKELGLSHPVDA